MASRTIEIEAGDGGTFSGYLAVPDSGSGPGLILGQEIFGINGTMRETAETMETAWNDYRERFETVDESLAKVFSEINTGLEAQREHVEKFVRGLDTELDKALRALSGGIEELSSSVDEISESAERIAESLRSRAAE